MKSLLFNIEKIHSTLEILEEKFFIKSRKKIYCVTLLEIYIFDVLD